MCRSREEVVADKIDINSCTFLQRMQQLGQYHMYSMQFEGILNSTTRILSRLDDNVNSSRYIIQVILSFYLFS